MVNKIKKIKINANDHDFDISVLLKRKQAEDTATETNYRRYIREGLAHLTQICSDYQIGLNYSCSNDTSLVYIDLKSDNTKNFKLFLDSFSNAELCDSKFMLQTINDSIVFSLDITPSEFEDGEIIIECPVPNKTFYPEFNKSTLIVSRISEDAYRYTFSKYDEKTQTISLAYNPTKQLTIAPVSLNKTEPFSALSDSLETAPLKTGSYFPILTTAEEDDIKIPAEKIWLFGFAALGAIGVIIQIIIWIKNGIKKNKKNAP